MTGFSDDLIVGSTVSGADARKPREDRSTRVRARKGRSARLENAAMMRHLRFHWCLIQGGDVTGKIAHDWEYIFGSASHWVCDRLRSLIQKWRARGLIEKRQRPFSIERIDKNLTR
jgi:hypothetical protein